MKLNKALECDSHSAEEVTLYLEIVQEIVGRLQKYCPTTYDYLCAEAHNRGDLTLSDLGEAISCATDILNTGATSQPITSIDFPKHWCQPKFKFGQVVKQGIIVGMNYYQAIFPDGADEGWVYSVQVSAAGELESINEFKIELLVPNDLRSSILNELNFYKSQIAVLESRLKTC